MFLDRRWIPPSPWGEISCVRKPSQLLQRRVNERKKYGKPEWPPKNFPRFFRRRFDDQCWTRAASQNQFPTQFWSETPPWSFAVVLRSCDVVQAGTGAGVFLCLYGPPEIQCQNPSVTFEGIRGIKSIRVQSSKLVKFRPWHAVYLSSPRVARYPPRSR